MGPRGGVNVSRSGDRFWVQSVAFPTKGSEVAGNERDLSLRTSQNKPYLDMSTNDPSQHTATSYVSLFFTPNALD